MGYGGRDGEAAPQEQKKKKKKIRHMGPVERHEVVASWVLWDSKQVGAMVYGG